MLSNGALRMIVALRSKESEQRVKDELLERYPRHLLGAIPFLVSSELVEDANDARVSAAQYAGDPNFTASNWSFDRWSAATGQEADELRSLHRADPNSFYGMIGRDPQFNDGWSSTSGDTRTEFQSMQQQADDKRSRSRMAAGVIWLNHIVAAAHAFRAARLHNVPLQQNLELQLKPSWSGGEPGLMAVVEKTF